MELIARRTKWWEQRLSQMSPDIVKQRNQATIAQMRVWYPLVRALVAGARKYDAVPTDRARFIDDTVDEWETASLPVRLAVLGSVAELLTFIITSDVPAASAIRSVFYSEYLATNKRAVSRSTFEQVE